MELANDHFNTNVLDETKDSLRWVYDSIVAEWYNELETIKSGRVESNNAQLIQKAYALIENYKDRSDDELYKICAGGSSCLIFAIQIILVSTGYLRGRGCIDGINGPNTQQAIIAYKKKKLGYRGAYGTVNTRFLQTIDTTRKQKTVVVPGPVPVAPAPNPIGPDPEVLPEEQVDPELIAFLDTLPEAQRAQAKVFIEAVIKKYAGVCDKKVPIPFEVIRSKAKTNIGNPIIRLTKKQGGRRDESEYEYPYYNTTGLKSISTTEQLLSSVCTYLNTKKKSVFYK